MARPGNVAVAGILEYSYRLMSVYGCYISVSLDCTIYMLGVFAIEVSRLIGTCLCSLFKSRHNTSIFAFLILNQSRKEMMSGISRMLLPFWQNFVVYVTFC